MTPVSGKKISDLSEVVNDLSEGWRKSGLEKNDTVMVHSSMTFLIKKLRILNGDIKIEDILKSLMHTVGDKGTLIFPVYNFGFSKGKTFDIKNTKSETGILSETARMDSSFIRTGHPMFSFAVSGYHRNKFEGLYNHSAFGKDSPFGILTELDGKIAAIDVAGENCMTYYHYVEEMENAENRFHKLFSGNYIDYDDSEKFREFNVYSRKSDEGVETDVKPMEELLWSKNLYKGYRPFTETGMHTIQAQTVYKEASKIIREKKSKGMLYRIDIKN